MKKNAVMMIMAAVLLSMISSAFAENNKSVAGQTKAVKEVQGEISGIGKDYISIIYQKDDTAGVDYEIMLPMTPDMQLEHKTDLDNLKAGDVVRVQYEETTEQDDKGPKSSRKAQGITFVKSGVSE
ncbi:MAG: hypothetical protein PHO30_00550 [Candidatus Omnitrophica bacterium]|jgi:hypothetical protein|nr:hypothetical protein [Candidatus Omnitrophota bacterium]